MRLRYSVIRFAPRPARGEFLNVGFLIVDQDAPLAKVELALNGQRLRAVADKQLIVTATDYLEGWKAKLESPDAAATSSGFSDQWLEALSDAARNVFEFSRPAPVAVDSIKEACDLLRAEFLPIEVKREPRTTVTRKQAVVALRSAYEEQGLARGVDFLERPLIKGKNHRETMDFAVTNGAAVQIAQAWNFRQRYVAALTEAVKAWAWTIKDIREKGGSGEWRDRDFAVPYDVDVEVTYIEPDTAEGGDVLAEALHAFRDVKARALPVDDSNKTALRASRALASHASR
jgi:hypothetical protein